MYPRAQLSGQGGYAVWTLVSATCRAMYGTANCGQTVTLVGPCSNQTASCTARLILKFDNSDRFCIVASILSFNVCIF